MEKLKEPHIEIGLALAKAHVLFIPRQYLYSTRYEIALVQLGINNPSVCVSFAMNL